MENGKESFFAWRLGCLRGNFVQNKFTRQFLDIEVITEVPRMSERDDRTLSSSIVATGQMWLFKLIKMK